MIKQRKLKVLFMIALIVGIVGMSISFAAFSSSLNISSGANVTPNSENFKIRLIGLNGDNKLIVSSSSVEEQEPIYVNSDGLTISGARARLSKPGDEVRWVGILENVGEYDAYFVSKELGIIDGETSQRKCTPALENGASLELLASVCNTMKIAYGIYEYDEETGELISGKTLPIGSVIGKGEKYLFHFIITYREDAPYVDGDFEILYGDVKLVFSTVM